MQHCKRQRTSNCQAVAAPARACEEHRVQSDPVVEGTSKGGEQLAAAQLTSRKELEEDCRGTIESNLAEPICANLAGVARARERTAAAQRSTSKNPARYGGTESVTETCCMRRQEVPS